MNLTVEEISETRKKLVVSVAADEVDKEQSQLLEEFSQQARIPGFRPGKAPKQLVRKRFAKNLAKELNRKMTTKAYDQAVKESELDICAVVSIDKDDFKAGEGSEFALTVDINPAFNLPDYLGIPTEVPSIDINDEEIEEAITAIRTQRAQYNEVDRPAQKGDFVKVSYEGKIGDKPISELVNDRPIWGKQENTWEEIGESDSPGVPAIVEGALEMKAGDKKEYEMEFSDDFAIPELAGKKATYALEMHEVRERVLPDIDEEFLKSMEAEDIEQLREQVGSQLHSRKEQERRSSQRRQITEALSERIEFPLPESALEHETNSVMSDIVRRNLQQGMSEEDLESHKEEIFESARRAAAERVKINILLHRIGEEEKIEVEEEDMQRFIMTEAIATRRNPQDLVKEIGNDSDRMMSIRRSIMVNKTLEHVVEKSTVTVKEG